MKEGQVGWTIHKRRKLIWSDAGRVSRDCERPCVLGKEFRAYPKSHRKLLVANRNTTSFTLGNDHPVLNIVCVLRAGRKWQVDQLSTYCNNPGERYQDSGLEWWYQKYRKLDRFKTFMGVESIVFIDKWLLWVKWKNFKGNCQIWSLSKWLDVGAIF